MKLKKFNENWIDDEVTDTKQRIAALNRGDKPGVKYTEKELKEKLYSLYGDKIKEFEVEKIEYLKKIDSFLQDVYDNFGQEGVNILQRKNVMIFM